MPWHPPSEPIAPAAPEPVGVSWRKRQIRGVPIWAGLLGLFVVLGVIVSFIDETEPPADDTAAAAASSSTVAASTTDADPSTTSTPAVSPTSSSSTSTSTSTSTVRAMLTTQLPASETTIVATQQDINTALAVLASLTVTPEPPRSGYSRDSWPHWQNANGSGCDARQDTLVAQAVGRPQIDPYSRGCVVVEDDWYSYWDGIMYAGSPSELDIDHIVALTEAHDSGAAGWSTEQKRRFANDPANLVAVTAASNRSKSDEDLGEWRPIRSAWCTAATITVNVKAAYGLSVDARERDALEEMLGVCGEPGQVTIGAPLPERLPTAPATTATPNTTSVPNTTSAPNTTTAPTVAPTTIPPSSAPPNPGDTKNCGDFGTYAKAWFDTYYLYYGDVARLDNNGDLEPCESLSGAPG